MTNIISFNEDDQGSPGFMSRTFRFNFNNVLYNHFTTDYSHLTRIG